MKNKNDEEKNNLESIKDIHGRIESLDQSIRSVDSRLRAVEKRLSPKTLKSEPGTDQSISGTQGKKDIYYEIEELRESIEALSRSMDEIVINERFKKVEDQLIHVRKTASEEHAAGISYLEEQLSDSRNRITKLENLNKITIGNIKIPIELSGLIAAFVLIGTGYLIANNQWSIIRSFYYPIALGILFGAVVIAKFVMTNRDLT